MKRDDPPNAEAFEGPPQLNFRVPGNDRALGAEPASHLGCAYTVSGACAGSLALPMSAHLAASSKMGVLAYAAAALVVLIAICCAIWKPTRPFGIGLLIGMGIFLLLLGACFVAVSGRL